MKRIRAKLVIMRLWMICFFCALNVSALNTMQEAEEKDFIASFIQNYGFTPGSRDTHEYHSYILGKTRTSFEQLEKHLRSENFTIAGRSIICGYQADAIPSYYTFDDAFAIKDEHSYKTNAGWQFAAGNIFGYLTGFLLHVAARGYKSSSCKTFSLHHILSPNLGLFDDRALIFQKHAFGGAYQLIEQFKKPVNKVLIAGDAQQLFALLYEFWRQLYVNDVRDGQGNLIATQDILFSMHYAQYSMKSRAPITHFFTGPDITYPIEIVAQQKEGVTREAQECVKRLIDTLHPIEQQPTAYILCSFVDGVGKSTLLGNIKNWCAYGTDLARYNRVDNSSSQQADFFALSDTVTIVDLPAQSSHFICKPDGLVYVDIDMVKAIHADEKLILESHVFRHKDQLLNAWKTLLSSIKDHSCAQLRLQKGEDVSLIYAKQCCVLNCRETSWIPFMWGNEHYLFNKDMPSSIRILQPLAGVHSQGLKGSLPEQMIFNKGISLPLKYDVFLQSLTRDLKARGIQKIVFIDCMSMYPRTSRENIRVNFIVQQLKYMFGDSYQVDKSAYRGFSNAQELYGLLHHHGEAAHNCLVQETCMRYALYTLHDNYRHEDQTSIMAGDLHDAILRAYSKIYGEHSEYIKAASKRKIMMEYEDLNAQYALDKNFQAIITFDPKNLIEFSRFMYELCTQQIKDARLNFLWASMDNPASYETVYEFDSACKDAQQLEPIFNCIRFHWYQTIGNLFKINQSGGIQGEHFPAPPLMIIKGDGHMIRVVRKRLPECFDEQKIATAKLEAPFDWLAIDNWAFFEDRCYPLVSAPGKTIMQVYCYGYNPEADKVTVITRLIAQMQTTSHLFIPASVLALAIEKQGLWQTIVTEHKAGANNKAPKSLQSKEAARLGLRALATLEMIGKDVHSPVMVRTGNNHDFSAAILLFERIIAPCYFGTDFKMPLFQNYSSLEPVIKGLLPE